MAIGFAKAKTSTDLEGERNEINNLKEVAWGGITRFLPPKEGQQINGLGLKDLILWNLVETSYGA
jgi:hypothetical protein